MSLAGKLLGEGDQVSTNLLTMRIGDTRPFIDRNYRDITQPGQWLRETFRNADEAEASNVHYGIEWQGVETQGVYRRYIADDGVGMDEGDLDEFMLTYGGGGKPIGTEHENYGIGAKVTLLPWNSAGLLVISYKDGNGYAMHMRGEDRDYGAKPWEAEDEDGNFVMAAVIDPDGASLGEFGIADLGAIWQQVPFWADQEGPPEHGTIFLLLGAESDYDTLLGDPSRPTEATTYMQAQYLNSRLWVLAERHRVTIDVPVGTDKNTWTKRNPGQISSGPGTGGFTRRPIAGARWHIDRGDRLAVEAGHVVLADGTRVSWWLRDEDPEKRPNPYGPRAGFIGVLYRDELYDVARAEDAKWRYRQFGIPAAEVMARTFLVIEPPIEGPNGIYPTGGRDRLLRSGGRELPFADWGAEFHDKIPAEIKAAIEEAMPRELALDSTWKERFAERFWDRLHQLRLRLRSDGTVEAGEPMQTAPHVDLPPSENPENKARPHLPRLSKPRERTSELVVTDSAGRRRGRKTDMESSIPSYLPVPASEMDQPYTLASWDPEAANHDGSRGCVYINREHTAITALIEEMAKDYNITPGDRASWGQIESAVWETLGQSLVAKVVHAQAVLRRDVERTTLRKEYLSDIALTTAGLGMIWEQQALQPKIGGLLGRKKVS
jgi:hypothetical protein